MDRDLVEAARRGDREAYADLIRSRGDRLFAMLALITRDRGTGARVPGYCLTPAGTELQPMMRGLWTWSKRWVPEDPIWAERDPDVIIAWLSHRVDRSALPNRRTVIQLDIEGTNAKRGWLVLEPKVEPALCIEDPFLPVERYVYVEADATGLYPIARGLRAWTDAIADGSVRVFGEPALVRELPRWFRSVEPVDHAGSAPRFVTI